MNVATHQSQRQIVRYCLFALAAVALCACAPSARDSIVLPESAPAEVVAALEDDEASVALSEAAEGSSADTTSVTAISPDVTIPEAVSESGRNPRFGGGNGGISLVDALSVNMPTVGGPRLDVDEYLGQDVVLWFWAPWCAWCNAEAERVNELATEFDDRVEFVGVSGLSDEVSMQEFVDRHELGHITHLNDVDGQFWIDLDVTYQPWWMFINDTGEVVLNWQGRLSEEEIRDVMNVLLAS